MLFIMFTIFFEMTTVKKYNRFVFKRWVSIEKTALFIFVIYCAVGRFYDDRRF